MLLALITFAVSLFAALDSEMSSQEIKETGILKLSPQERSSLQGWIASRYSKKNKQKKPLLEENLKGGHYIRLSDGTLWEINPSDTPITQGWISAVEIDISPSGDINYPTTLTNTLTGSSVRAKTAKATSKASPNQK